MKLVIAAPANGVELKNALKTHLQNDPRVTGLVDLSSPDGTYPQLSFAAAQEVAAGRADRAILICGTGVGTCSPCAARWKTTTQKCFAWGKMSSPPPPLGRW